MYVETIMTYTGKIYVSSDHVVSDKSAKIPETAKRPHAHFDSDDGSTCNFRIVRIEAMPSAANASNTPMSTMIPKISGKLMSYLWCQPVDITREKGGFFDVIEAY